MYETYRLLGLFIYLLKGAAAVEIPSAIAVELDELLPEMAENGTTTRMAILQGETILMPCKAYSLGQRTVCVCVCVDDSFLLSFFPSFSFYFLQRR